MCKQVCKSVPHKYAEIIKAWADGATIQARNTNAIGRRWHSWHDDPKPCWSDPGWEFRIKPQKKSAAQVYWEAAHRLQHDDEDPGPVPSYAERGVKAVIEAYKRGEIEE